MAIINSAKDWQDMLQSVLPGYRERIVHIHLKDDEGGLNLSMPSAKIDDLVGFGDRAGALLSGEETDQKDKAPFDMDDHRWRRFLVAFARLEETLCKTASRWNQASGIAGESFGNAIHRILPSPHSYDKSTFAWRRQVVGRFDSLMQHVAPWCDEPLRAVHGSQIPKPHTDIRITPKLDEPGD